MVHLSPADCVACVPKELARVIARDSALAARWNTLAQRRLTPGTTLVAQGSVTAHVWLVQRGLVRFYFLSADGVERNKSFHAEGAWIGSGMPPRAAPSPYTIEALEAVDLLELPYAELAGCARDFPEVGAMLQEALSWTFEQQTAREAELLLLDAVTRYQRFIDERPDLAARLPLHHVASYLGITNVALSRIRGRLGLGRKKGAVAAS